MDIETVLELTNKIQAQKEEIKFLKAKLKYVEHEVLSMTGGEIKYPPKTVLDEIAKTIKD